MGRKNNRPKRKRKSNLPNNRETQKNEIIRWSRDKGVWTDYDIPECPRAVVDIHDRYGRLLGDGVAKKNKAPLKDQAQGHQERLEELDQGNPLREKPRGARGEHLPHDSDDAENAEKRDYSQAERRRLAREGKALPNLSYPIDTVNDLHNAAVLARTGHGDVEAARQLIARRARELGVKNPLDNAKSIGNPVNSPLIQHLRARGLAVGHPDLSQSSTDFGSTVQAGSDKPTFIGGAGFHSAFSGTDTPAGADQGRPRVRVYDARSGAGSVSGLGAVPSGLDVASHRDGRYSSAPTGASSNGTHSLDNPVSHVGQKASDRLEIMKQAMRGEL